MRYLPLLLLAIALLSCSQARKMEKKRRQAEALVKEAIETYPDILQVQVQTDTIVMWTEPKAGAGRRMYSQASMDSLATICAQILSRQRHDASADVLRLAKNVCHHDTVRLDTVGLQLLIWSNGRGIGYWYYIPSEKLDTVATSSQRIITTEPCPPATADRHWTRWAFWLLLILVLGGFIWVLTIMIRTKLP